MKKTMNFNKKLLATLVASSSFAAYSNIATAQTADVETIEVSGIRASVKNAMDIKRDAVGVVDAISSEDIGKMPDSNLAESLQRVTGVSISRTNGEGSQVTIRGIDPSLNMVLLNGRVMPTVTNTNVGDGASRAFDFANIASETISGVDVYKTGKVNYAAGGLGGTINVKTLRPLDLGKTKATFGAKAVEDDSIKYGTAGAKYTPEASGLYSWLNDDKNFGVALDGAYQKRDSARSLAFVNAWNLYQGTSVLPANVAVNGPAAGQYFNLPTDLRYQLENNERTRENAQLTMQFKPVDSVTGTLDYTYSEVDIKSHRQQQSTWYNVSNISYVSFDNGVVKSPLVYVEQYGGGKDVSFALDEVSTNTKNNSFGVNFVWEATDSLKLAFDFHNSSAESHSHDTQFGLNANIVTGNYSNWTKDLPVMGITFDDSNPVKGNNNGVIDGGDMSGAMGSVAQAMQRTTVKQAQINGSYDFGDIGGLKKATLDFGIDKHNNTNLSLAGSGTSPRITMGNWGGVDPAEFGAGWSSYFTPRNFGSAYPDAGSTAKDPKFLSTGLVGNFDLIKQRLEYMYNSKTDPANFQNFPNGKVEFNGVYETNRKIKEDVKAAYVAFKSGFDIGSMASNLAVGVRYESTDVAAIGSVVPPSTLQWASDNDWNVVYSDKAAVPVITTSSYNKVLPNIDFDMSPMESLKVRLSASQTMGRPAYQALSPLVSIGSAYSRTAASGNPGLKPQTSTNLDLSVEWYYTDDSYVSAGLWDKKLKDYIGTAVLPETHYGLGDVRTGPRFAAAVAELTADRAANVMTTNYSTTVPVLSNPADEAQQWDRILKDMGVVNPSPSNPNYIYANSADPLMVFGTTKPVNNKDAHIHGAEFAVQHWFGQSGFGMQANYTIAKADVGFDNTANDATTQFAMVGLSNSYNVIGFYDKNAWSARIAYNWRDKYFQTGTQGGINEPGNVKAFGELDFQVAFKATENLTFTLEGLNVLGTNSLLYGRSETQVSQFEDLSARYDVGVRYTF